MNEKKKGIIIPIATVVIIMIIGLVWGIYESTIPTNEFGNVIAIFLSIVAVGIVLLVEFIVALVLYFRHDSNLGLGMLTSISILAALAIFGSLVSATVSAFI